MTGLRQQVHGTPRFEVTHDGSVAYAFAPRPVINAHDPQVGNRSDLHAVNQAENGVRADGSVKVWASLAPASPPKRTPIRVSRSSSRLVRRAWGRTNWGKRSANTRRRQVGLLQRNRRTVRWILTVRPSAGKSMRKRV